MGKIRLTGATSGYTEIQAASAAGNNTIILPTTNGGQVIVSDSSGNVNIDSGTFYVDASNNRVGIGTTSPGALLHLRSTSARLFCENSTAGETAEFGVDATGALIQAGGAKSIVAYTNGSERARVDSSGRLLVGTSTSASTAQGTNIQQIFSSTNDRMLGVHMGINSANGPYITFSKSRNTGYGSYSIVNNGDVLGGMIFAGDDGTDYASAGAYIEAIVDGTPGANDLPTRLVFSTTADGASSPTERMRIGQSGNVSIGTTGSEGRITIVGDSCGGYIGAITNQNNSNCDPAHGLIFRAGKNGSFSGSNFFSFRTPNDTILGSISQSGASSVAYNTSSDYRLKENIAPLAGAIDRISQLKPSQFNFITEPGKTVDGFIAHEAQAVVPECVTGEKDAVDDDGNPVYQGIDQSKLVPLLTAALQEALAEIESLKARVTALEP